jgi:hypothetical protein
MLAFLRVPIAVRRGAEGVASVSGYGLRASRWLRVTENESLLERYRREAADRVAGFEIRYASDGASVALSVARRWLDALQADPPRMGEIADLARDSERLKRLPEADISLFAFCNRMVEDYRQLWREHLERGSRTQE